MRELTPHEIDKVAAGPTAEAGHAAGLLALPGQYNALTAMPAPAFLGIFPAIASVVQSSDIFGLTK